uniref:3-deoxy-7-phosphoheptulonate synthase n=1 Tax=Clostridioides difficile TaxID=1496 RepID=A0A381IAZ6_CLODI|nr:3-deoxy-7-phosphoheptulonate synthase [Clostridioides difficile]
MIVVLKMGADKNEVKKLIEAIGREGVEVNPIDGTELTVLGLVGDTSKIDAKRIEANKVVEKVMHVVEPFKKANRKFHPEPSIINVNGMEIGSKKIAMIAGPCSVETEDQIVSIAKDVKKSGAGFLRGGAFKPRTSPYAFQGLKYDGLDLLKKSKRKNRASYSYRNNVNTRYRYI